MINSISSNLNYNYVNSKKNSQVNGLSNNTKETNSNNNILNNTISNQTQTKETTSNLVNDKAKATNEILGYGVDKDGFFTSDFNEVSEIPKDYKIYAKGVENLVNYITKSEHKFFDDMDIAKTIGNAYKIFSQLIDEPSDKFTIEDIDKIPLGFDFNKKTLQITNIYHTKEEFENILKANNIPTYENSIEHSLSFPSWQDDNPSGYIKKNDNIFASSSVDLGESFYKNDDDTISKGGVLMAFFAGITGRNSLIVGETTIAGKLNGYDKNMSIEEVRDLNNFANKPNTSNSILLLNDPSSIDELFKKLLDYENLTYKYTDVEDFKKAAQEWIKNNTKNRNDDISNISYRTNIQNKKTQENKQTFTPIKSESKNKETYKDSNLRSEALKKLLENKFDTSKELELLFGVKINDENLNNNNFTKIFSKPNLYNIKSVDLKA